ncbi:MAG: bestrophin family ion channel [Planctomycetota bacterium]
MYTRRNIRWSVILTFAWAQLIIFTVWGLAVTTLYVVLKSSGVEASLPIAPLGTIGVAVAFYIGFKNNQSYDRNWEARKIWGGIVNVSRSWGNQVMSYLALFHIREASSASVDEAELQRVQRELIYRHIAWINSLRYQLRRKTPFGFSPKGTSRKYMQATDMEALRQQLIDALPEGESATMCGFANTATQLLRRQGERLKEVYEDDQLIEDFRHISMMDLITEMYTLQGKCERIKNTPFPRQYAYFSNVFTWIFVILLPFGIVGEFADKSEALVWLTVPLSVVVSWIFFTMESVGDSSEDPFENFINDVPMTALCRTIEIDLRQMLGETDLPEPLKPIDDILM